MSWRAYNEMMKHVPAGIDDRLGVLLKDQSRGVKVRLLVVCPLCIRKCRMNEKKKKERTFELVET